MRRHTPDRSSSQFYDPNSNEPNTYISSPLFLESIKAKGMILGKQIGVEFAEGFITKKIIGFSNFDAFIKKIT